MYPRDFGAIDHCLVTGSDERIVIMNGNYLKDTEQTTKIIKRNCTDRLCCQAR